MTPPRTGDRGRIRVSVRRQRGLRRRDPSASGRTSPTVVVDGTTTTAAPVATPNTVEVGIDTARGSPETTATTSTVPAITAPPAPAPTGPVALTPPAPGTYHYATSGGVIVNGTPVPSPADTINTIGGPVGTRQVATREMRAAPTPRWPPTRSTTGPTGSTWYRSP